MSHWKSDFLQPLTESDLCFCSHANGRLCVHRSLLLHEVRTHEKLKSGSEVHFHILGKLQFTLNSNSIMWSLTFSMWFLVFVELESLVNSADSHELRVCLCVYLYLCLSAKFYFIFVTAKRQRSKQHRFFFLRDESVKSHVFSFETSEKKTDLLVRLLASPWTMSTTRMLSVTFTTNEWQPMWSSLLPPLAKLWLLL